MARRDPRYESADAAIRAAFLRLFEERDIEDITASEIIRTAGINRSTFYAHYTDKYDLLTEVEGDFLRQMEDLFKESPTVDLLLGRESAASVWEAYFGRLIEFLHGNRRLFSGLVGRQGSAFMVDFSNAFAEVLMESGAVSRLGVPTNYRAALLSWATAGLVEEWARDGFVDDRERIVRILVIVAMGIQDAVAGEDQEP